MEQPVTEKLEEAFNSCLKTHPGTELNLAGAVQHALSHRGSMVRARLCYLVARAFNLEETPATNLALSVELFHTASLLFDDLPCMDDAQERRGVACTHVLYGEGVTTLAALAMINRAYGLLWSVTNEASPQAREEARKFVEKCLGLVGILNGQSHDLHFKAPGGGANPASRVMRVGVLKVAMGKTVSLVQMSLVLPALIAGAAAGQVTALRRLSVFWGLAYQIMDDLKDVLKSSVQARKTTHRDVFLGRPNFAIAEGPVRTSYLLTRLISLGETTLDRARGSSPVFEALRDFQRKVAGEFLQLQGSGS